VCVQDLSLGECMIKWLNIDKNYTPHKFIQDSFKWFKWTWLLFLKCYYYNLWIIHVQSSTNFPKSMWKLVFNVSNVIFQFGSPKTKTHKDHMNNDPCKAFKKYVFGTKKLKMKIKMQFIWTYENMVKFWPFKNP
jgi:hypothetical protein